MWLKRAKGSDDFVLVYGLEPQDASLAHRCPIYFSLVVVFINKFAKTEHLHALIYSSTNNIKSELGIIIENGT